MTAASETDVHRRIAEQAADWLLTLQSDELTPQQRAELVEWLCESPQHVAALFRICELQRDLSRFGKWRQIAPLSRTAPSKIMRLVPKRTAPSLAGRHWGRAAALAASVIFLCIAAWLSLARLGHQEFSTQAGERREITLADGSVLDLAPATDVAVRYRTHERLLTLEQGEAIFHVAKNRSRPFIVEAAETRVRAVGTIFKVQRTVRHVCVSVVEGVVAVSEEPPTWHRGLGAARPLPLLSLAANEQVSINLSGIISPVHWTNVSAVNGPGANRLTFDNQTVAEVARLFNGRNRMQIEISDSSLAARRISGIFPTDDPQSFVAFLQVAADVQVSQRDSTHILLGPAGNGAPSSGR
ncbi:MAG TPA: FecR domain-containing protein [Steroidobacteraceae bacterium]|jgi:transmembrane sensor|nr:FecR domain-containing protein [Steroidobacteraceae bacterium]